MTDMTRWTFFALYAGAAMLLAAGLIALYRVMRRRESEKKAKKRVGRQLASFALPRGFRVLDNAVLVADGLSGWADHIVVGHFGILLVYDLCWCGGFYGKPDEDKWTLNVPNKGRFQIDNPRHASVQCTGRINILLKAAGLKASTEHIIVLTGTTKDTINYIKADNLLKQKHLHSFLNRVKFDQDKDVDVEAVTAVLTSALQTAEGTR